MRQPCCNPSHRPHHAFLNLQLPPRILHLFAFRWPHHRSWPRRPAHHHIRRHPDMRPPHQLSGYLHPGAPNPVNGVDTNPHHPPSQSTSRPPPPPRPPSAPLSGSRRHHNPRLYRIRRPHRHLLLRKDHRPTMHRPRLRAGDSAHDLLRLGRGDGRAPLPATASTNAHPPRRRHGSLRSCQRHPADLVHTPHPRHTTPRNRKRACNLVPHRPRHPPALCPLVWLSEAAARVYGRLLAGGEVDEWRRRRHG